MEKDFEKLMTFAHQNLAQQLDGPPFTIYPVWDIVRKKVHYCACQPVTEYPEALPADFCQGQLEASKVHGVEHKGPYRHVANAWAVQMMYKQKKIFRANKKLAPIEIYHNSPTNTPERELISEIQFSVK
jgi:predicted transcriptional regulator YdeE